ncbi:acetyl-CoA synthetase-like protein [Hesseltinella vesiculosa]|uniref:Acetyl-CoA synthetase-like protein n=1 Tax=Hesseltinella vesiculosa TaxID=101127 RepID=A0A1X2GES9_9FUNG|nr:acetyl-CoA synthetase-like protein [Hesseltinella vesiculosa]
MSTVSLCKLVSNSQPGETGVYRRSSAPEGPLIQTYDYNVRTMYDAFQQGIHKASDLPCLGHRPVLNPLTKERSMEFVWDTFAEVAVQADQLGSGLRQLVQQYAPETNASIEGSTTTPLGIWSNNRKEWTIADIACVQSGYFSVALYDTLGQDTVQFVINHADLPLVMCAGQHIRHLIQIQQHCPTLKVIVSMDPLTADNQGPALQAWAEEKGIVLIDFDAVKQLGQQKPLPHVIPKTSDVALIMYTSGTTGMPKGVMLTHANMVAAFASMQAVFDFMCGKDVLLSYLPLPHIFGRLVEWCMLQFGGRIGCFSGEVELLLEDIQILKPTLFPSVPRLLNRIYSKLAQATIDAPGNVGRISRFALDAKVKRMREGHGVFHPVWDRLLFNKVRAVLGGRIRCIITGSAPIAAEVLDFYRVALCATVMEAYGSTENTGCATGTDRNETLAGHVGAPCQVTEVKLVDVPEMNYLTSAAVPRGEICTRGPTTFLGYYKDQAKTNEALVDGWYHSGDIGMMKDNRLVVVDRLKSIFKIAQGEYIAPEKVENVLTRDPLILQAFVYGDSLNSALVAVVVPDPDTLPSFAKAHGIDTTELASLCRDPKLNKLVLAHLTKAAKHGKLLGFEIPRAIHLESEAFSIESGILTPTMKLKRNVAKEIYQPQIDSMYRFLAATVPAYSRL